MTSRAERDLERIFGKAALRSAESVSAMLDEILGSIQLLATLPHRNMLPVSRRRKFRSDLCLYRHTWFTSALMM
jgi:plasmid stabilization system protein ParE